MSQIFLITPPFTQLNTPYPATAYLKGFLNTRNIDSAQFDLGIEVILEIFSTSGLQSVFDFASKSDGVKSENARRILALQRHYIKTIDPVISFLQGSNPNIAHLICSEGFLPQASRFDQSDELDWAFGTMGTQDRAKHLATLYLEDISDLIVECVDPHFGFSRYAERLARSANSFDELYEALSEPGSYTDGILARLLERHFNSEQPKLVALSVPFPGNLYAAFRIGQWLRKHFPEVKIAMGGGFPNTELRSVSDPRVFEFLDFICLDDGEAPIEHLWQYINGALRKDELKRAFYHDVSDGVIYSNSLVRPDYKQFDMGTPDYSGLPLSKYISVIELANPMHRMWSDGRWNKLTMAHGCYWGKCTFCDISLDYIKVYEPIAAGLLCDRMEQLITQTGQNGFHFVDEAAPPALMRSLALEIIRRGLVVSWWTNIRFEKSFTRDLCILLKESGCVAISGGLEVASDRLLDLIQKGVTVAQVASVTRNFTEAGIMVHAYLMYGFPTQTAQETVDSLEMVRQMFEAGILQSGFWHQFAMTAHSPVGMYPQDFKVNKVSQAGTFANNDIVHEDPTGTQHELFSYGLKKSLFNYMHGICFEYPLQYWFDHKIPRTTVKPSFIADALKLESVSFAKPSAKLVWLGSNPEITPIQKNKKGRVFQLTEFKFYHTNSEVTVQVDQRYSEWLMGTLELLSPLHNEVQTLALIKDRFQQTFNEDFEPLWYSKPFNTLRENGLLVL